MNLSVIAVASHRIRRVPYLVRSFALASVGTRQIIPCEEAHKSHLLASVTFWTQEDEADVVMSPSRSPFATRVYNKGYEYWFACSRREAYTARTQQLLTAFQQLIRPRTLKVESYLSIRSTIMPDPTRIIDTRLIPGAIYIILFLRHDTASVDGYLDDFHWGLYHHVLPGQGWKYHIKSMGSGWIADHQTASNFMQSFLLVGLMRIGYCNPSAQKDVQQIVESFPLNQVPPGYKELTCRTWALHIVHLLLNKGHVKCSDLASLDSEVNEWGLKSHKDACGNKQPRPITDSKVCKL